MKIGLFGIGGGGANVTESIQRLIERDLEAIAASNPSYAGLIRSRLIFRYADANFAALIRRRPEERIRLGNFTNGCGHDPDMGRQAFEYSKDTMRAAIEPLDMVIWAATTIKGCGAGGLIPAAQLSLEMKKLPMGVVVMGAMDAEEVNKQRNDWAMDLCAKMPIRYVQILNEAIYQLSDAEDKAHSIANAALAQSFRALLYALIEQNQYDSSDMMRDFAGKGRIRPGYVDLPDPETFKGDESARQIQQLAALAVSKHQYYGFDDSKVGTALVSIQGPYGMNVKKRLRSGLSTVATQGDRSPNYEPRNADALGIPKPWGFATWLFEHDPKAKDQRLDVVWSVEDDAEAPVIDFRIRNEPIVEAVPSPAPAQQEVSPKPTERKTREAAVRPSKQAEPLPEPLTVDRFAYLVNSGNIAAGKLAASEDPEELARIICDPQSLEIMLSDFGTRKNLKAAKLYGAPCLSYIRTRITPEMLEDQTFRKNFLDAGFKEEQAADSSATDEAEDVLIIDRSNGSRGEETSSNLPGFLRRHMGGSRA